MGVVQVRPLVLTAGSAGSARTGAQAASGWLSDRGLQTSATRRWHVEISLGTLDQPAPASFDDRVDTRFHVDIYSEEWGFFFCHQGHASWIRVTDIPFVHGRDDFQLVGKTPRLADIGTLIRDLESRHQVHFRRKLALVRSNVPGSEAAIRRWVELL